MFTVGAIIDRPQTTAKPKRATNGRPRAFDERPYKTISNFLMRSPLCGVIFVFRVDAGASTRIYFANSPVRLWRMAAILHAAEENLTELTAFGQLV